MIETETPYSLRRRLLLWLLIPLGLIAFLALLDSYFNARETANEAADRVLAGSVLAISERVYVNDEGSLEVDIPYVALDMLTSAAQDRVFYRIDGPDDAFVTGYHQLTIPNINPVGARAGAIHFSDTLYKNDKVRIAVMEAAASSGIHSIPFRVSVAETTIAREKLTREILVQSALRLALLIASAGVIVWFAVTRSLRPLVKLEAAIGRRNPDDLRPILHHVPQEVDGLVVRINAFMARLSGAIAALKNFTGNASHQIRTPLTIIRTQIALAQRASHPEEAQIALEACNQAISDAERTLSQLMLLARLDEQASQKIENAQTDLAETARDVAMALVPEASKAGFDLGFEGEETLLCKVDAVLVSELLKNLVDNAIKHAGGGDEITVRVLRHEQNDVIWARLEVEDNGPGMASEAMILADRFQTVPSGTKGTGLGLAIVREIVSLFDGHLSINTPGVGQGCHIRVDFHAVTSFVPKVRETNKSN